MGILRWMAATAGDKHIEWDPKDERSVETAKTRFDELRSEGFTPYAVQDNAIKRTGSPLKEFDPELREILFTAPAKGG